MDWNEPQAQAFKAAMDDDFNTSGAVAALFELASEANRSRGARAAGQLKALGALLGLLQQDPAVYFQSATRYGAAGAGGSGGSGRRRHRGPHRRARGRQAGARLRLADRIRDELRAEGIELDDKPGGVTQWRRA